MSDDRETSLAPSARLRLHLGLLAGLTGAVWWLATVSNRQHWGRASFLSLEGATAWLAWFILGLDAIISTIAVLTAGRTPKRIVLIHLVSPVIALGVFIAGVALLLVAAEALNRSS